MKKLTSIFVVVALCFTCSFAQAQGSETKTKTKGKGDMAGQTMAMKSGMMMQNGKMMVMKDGTTTVMTEEMTLSNGTKVMQDGSVKMADGSTVTLHDGDHLTMDGRVMHHHNQNADNADVKKNTKLKSTDEKIKIEGQGEKVKTKYDK